MCLHYTFDDQNSFLCILYLDYDIMVPIGSQGDYISYAYVKGELYRMSAINEISRSKITEENIQKYL